MMLEEGASEYLLRVIYQVQPRPWFAAGAQSSFYNQHGCRQNIEIESRCVLCDAVRQCNDGGTPVVPSDCRLPNTRWK